MSFRCPSVSFAILLLSTCLLSQQTTSVPEQGSPPSPAAQTELRVCADGDNMPYSNQKQQGLDNKIAELLARDMGAKLTYYWSRMGRGYIRDVLNAGKCDLLIEIPTDFRLVLTTPPYYRSSYVFVTRKDRNLRIVSLNDERLAKLQIGVQILAENYSPPGQALGKRGVYTNIVGFESTGEEAGNIISAVANGKIDVAIVWGPLAGFYAKRQQVSLVLTPVSPAIDPPGIPFTYAISMGVKKGNTQLRDQLTSFLERRKLDIDTILHDYNVPLLSISQEKGAVTGNE